MRIYKTLYIAAGNHGWLYLGGWNGGGNGSFTNNSAGQREWYWRIGCGGGGATHIATELIGDGQLKNYVDNKDYVLLAAGGAGGGGNSAQGGGEKAGKGSYNHSIQGNINNDELDILLSGATGESGYAFGQGQSAGFGDWTMAYYGKVNSIGAGGGGWYGGRTYAEKSIYIPNKQWYGSKVQGGGGSGHVGNVLSGTMKNGVNTGDGYAVITLTQEYLKGNLISDIYAPDLAAPNMPSNGKIPGGENGNVLLEWDTPNDNGTTYWHKISSYLKDSESATGLSDVLNEQVIEDTVISGVKGYYYYIDTNPTGIVTTQNTYTRNNSVEIPVATSDRYLHVAAIDKAGNLSGTYTMKIPSIAKYAVNHYVQNEDGTYTLVETEEFMDTIGKIVTPAIHPQTGRDNPPVQSIVIAADGKAVVNYYYNVTRFNINGTVSWNDKKNIYKTRPDNIGVTIYKDGKYFDYVTVPANEVSNRYSFPNLQKYDLTTGREFVYMVSQDVAYSKAADATSEDKYVTKQSGFNFLNTIRNTDADRPEEPDPGDKGFYVEGNIYWDDNDDLLGFRPSETTITLYQKGKDGEWHIYREPIVVDSKTENRYLFDWLPKYWYDENDEPTAYEYKVEESFTAWYMEDGEIKDVYTIIADQPNDFDFTNVFNKPDGPIIPVNEHNNTLTIITNTDEQVRIILKPLKLFIGDNYSVSYGDETGDNILVFVDNNGFSVDYLVSTRYEVVIESPEYNIDDMKLNLADNISLEYIDGKYYVTIENVPDDALGTLEIELSKKEEFYQDSKKINNFFKVDTITKAASAVKKMSLFIAKPGNPVAVLYMDSNTEDPNEYEIGEQTEILDYLGIIPGNMEFAGWAEAENMEKPQYFVGDNVELEDSLTLYPVFLEIEETREIKAEEQKITE